MPFGTSQEASEFVLDPLLVNDQLRTFSIMRWKPRSYRDNRTWRQRTDRAIANWKPLIPEMVDTYLQWKYHQAPVDETPLAGPSSMWDFTIDVVNIFSLRLSTAIMRSEHDKTAPSLVKNGYIGNTPESPSLAISIKTLELFRRLRLRKPSLSVEAFAKVICDFYVVCCFVMIFFDFNSL